MERCRKVIPRVPGLISVETENLAGGIWKIRLRVDNRGFTISSEKTALVVATHKSEHSSKLKYPVRL